MNQVLFLVGPTGSGKSEVALKLARKLHGELISCDAMQVYKGMDIGTAKPALREQGQVKHHLIDLVSPKSEYSVFKHRLSALRAIRQIQSRNHLPIVVGGSGLYVKAITNGLHSDWDSGTQSLETFGIKPLFFGLFWDRKKLYERIESRVDGMFRKGWVKEVQRLKRKGFSKTAKAAIGYKEILESLRGKKSIEEASLEIKKRTRHFAKRQMTWFRKEKRIHWIPVAGNRFANRAVQEIVKNFKEMN